MPKLGVCVKEKEETNMPLPEWVQKHKKTGCEIKRIKGKYYLYELKSKWDKTKKKPVKVSGKYLGTITPTGFQPKKITPPPTTTTQTTPPTTTTQTTPPTNTTQTTPPTTTTQTTPPTNTPKQPVLPENYIYEFLTFFRIDKPYATDQIPVARLGWRVDF